MARPLHMWGAADRHDAAYRVTINSPKGDNMKRLFALALLSGCNTVEGAGKDIQKGGEKIKEEAKENKKY